MADIVLTTLNARYWHSAFGLRYLQANLAELESRSTLLEFGIKDAVNEILEKILAHKPRLIGIGVYIWNIEPVTRLVADLKQVAPEISILIGGPEVSYEYEDLPLFHMADYLITGEGDLAFRDVCRDLLAGRRPLEKVIAGGIPDLSQIQLPYHLYTEEDIAHRVIYVEASRGCPFTCEFCLSSLEIPVRQFDLDLFLQAMQDLLDRGARQFKFVDRTFNLNMRVSQAILQFFLERYEPGLFLHFEMIPDRLPDGLRQLIAQFPPGALQFEIGIQTFNDEVGQFISRKQNVIKLRENFQFLRQQTGVHIHADLIIGLPGESLESFAAGFDELVRLDPQEIQVGILKRLRGTPITRHDAAWEMRYSPSPPYEILANRLLDFETMQEMKRFARFWDLIANSGNFVESCPWLWQNQRSPFAEFRGFSNWVYQKLTKTHGIPLPKLAELLFRFLTEVQQREPETMAPILWRDYTRCGREDRPHFLRGFDLPLPLKRQKQNSLPARQSKHQAREESTVVE